ncbi:MAG: hypothetical protein A2623_06845 [Caulobacterales bacterium RIFCSPHIGHO2_01_FULL_70_19]|nr:MAG: hypothetical protein A2623_06845 [Caulobacterales bacterium RIFCSPHIGHO2_01_FULL_70_19]
MKHARHAARTHRASQELMEASGDVVARRLEIIAEAVRDPLKADYAELALMGSEKVEALTASAAIGVSGALRAAETVRRAAQREGVAARKALDAMAAARTPIEAAGAQGLWALNAWNRTLRDSWALGAAMLKLQADALQPIHAAATANARRLRNAAE